MLSPVLALLLLLTASIRCPARAGSVAPSDRVTRYVVVRANPSGESPRRGQLGPGKRAVLLGEEPGWYKIRLLDGTEGYVSKAWTVVSSGTEPSNPQASGGIVSRRISSVADFPASAPAHGTYRVHLIDVGTGLSILVQGHDFNFLYDGGSNDDGDGISASGNHSRLLAYLYGAIGPSGPTECVPDGDHWTERPGGEQLKINDVVLSHPHKDHVDMLDEVLRCYEVSDVWDSGVVNPSRVYADFLRAVAAEPGVKFHTVEPLPTNRTYRVANAKIVLAETVSWEPFSEGAHQTLGDGASFTVLHADPEPHTEDYNRNSLVLRVDLGQHSLLLMGDAESGHRKPPSSPPGWAEEELLDHHLKDVQVEILQVGHHGSKTSSREAFIEAVKPKWALISSGPFKYSGVVLPDQEVVEELANHGATVLRTDLNDGHCPVADRIGRDDDAKPGGCDNYILEIGP